MPASITKAYSYDLVKKEGEYLRPLNCYHDSYLQVADAISSHR